MTQTSTHPDENLLTAYSAASLPLSQALCISSHVEHCHHCASTIKRLESIGSEFMQQLKPSRVPDSLKHQLLEQLDELDNQQVQDRSADIGSNRNPEVPSCLHQFIKTDYDHLNWKRVSPDIHSIELCRDSNGAKVELLKIKPGGSSGSHTHLGDEYTVILKGSFSDEFGLYRQGDFLHRDASHEHKPVASLDQACICLAVTEGPVQFTGFFSRMLNPLIRRSYQ